MTLGRAPIFLNPASLRIDPEEGSRAAGPLLLENAGSRHVPGFRRGKPDYGSTWKLVEPRTDSLRGGEVGGAVSGSAGPCWG